MPAPTPRTLLHLTTAAAVVLGSFWITLKILDYSAAPEDPNADLIEVTQATYGLNCQGTPIPGGGVNQVKAGNATAIVSNICDKARESCAFAVDVNQIGDTAPGCGKDMSIAWRCGSETTVHTVHVAPEAHSKTISLTCPWR
jgi:hypothetical protein